MAGSVFLFTISARRNAKRLKEGQNIKQLRKSLIEMKVYLRTSASGISPLMLLSWITLRKARIIVATPTAVFLFCPRSATWTS